MSPLEIKLIQSIEAILLSEFDYEAPNAQVMLEIPNNSDNGDYASNIAMRLTKVLKKNPREIASVIVEGLQDNELLNRIEIAGP